MFPESLLHFIWKFQLWNTQNLQLAGGDTLCVEFPGQHNHDSGPDFSHARIIVNGITWVGNIEIHINASDWYKHGHQHDAAYGNVVLHAVWNGDKSVFIGQNQALPTLIMERFVDKHMLETWLQMSKQNTSVACASYRKPPEPWKQSWLSRMLVERLESRIDWVSEVLKFTANNWEEAFYLAIARGFGAPVNAFGFEWMSRTLPVALIEKHRHNCFQLEALFLGQSGLITEDNTDDYIKELFNEYTFLKKAYRLSSLLPSVWKYSRMRPGNFPERRLAQFAALWTTGISLARLSRSEYTLEELLQLFDVKASAYWERHYRPDKPSKMMGAGLSRDTQIRIVINSIVPITFSYARFSGNEALAHKVISWLEQLPAEENGLIKRWGDYGIRSVTAGETQALMHLQKTYCETQSCLSCNWGLYYLKNASGGVTKIKVSLEDKFST